MNLPNKFPSYTKYNAVEVMKTIEGLIDCCSALEGRLAEAEAKLAKCGSCDKAPVKKPSSK